MRTKHILTALALPALFAACTADDFVNEGANAGLQERAKLSKDFKLITSDASTRYTISEQGGSLSFNFNEGDKVGAAVVDQYVPSADPADWDIIPSLAGNTPFEYKGNDVWQANSELGIGHYIYVYPYNAKDNNRAALSYEIPAIQNLFTSESGALELDACIKANNKAVYSALLTEGETQLEAQFKNLYAYPKFVINFDNGEPITEITQVVLEKTDNWALKGGLNHKKVWDLFDGAVDHLTFDTEDEYWQAKQTKDFVIASTTEGSFGSIDETEYTDFGDDNKYIIAKLPKGTKVSHNSITNNKYIEVRFMMPGDVLSAYSGKLNMYVYTNNGVYKVNDVASNIAFKSTTPADTKARALARNTSFTLQLNKLYGTNIVNALNVVTNVNDWNDLVAKYGASTTYTAVSPLGIAIVGNEFKLDASAKMPSKAYFQITTPVSVEGTVTLSNLIISNATNDNVLTVKKGAVLTTSYDFVADKIVNEGEVVIAPKPATRAITAATYQGVSAIVNKATLTVQEGANAAFALENAKGATMTNEGTLNISGSNYGTITNKGIINTTDMLTNESREYKENATTYYELVNEPTIINAAGAKILAEGLSANLVNKAKIENNGVLTCKNGNGKIINDCTQATLYGSSVTFKAELDSKKDALSYITENEKGVVVVYDAAATGLTIGDSGKVGTVRYTTSAASESFENSLVNTVIASKDYAITKGKLTSLTINGKATLKVATGVTVDGLTVAAGTTTLGTDLAVTNLSILKGAMVVVPEGKKLTVNATAMSNNGTILVGGVFNAEKIAKGAAGTGLVEDNGNGTINWSKTQEEKDEAKKAEAFQGLVDAWIKNTSLLNDNSTWTDVTTAAIQSTPWDNSAIAWVVAASDEFMKTWPTTITRAEIPNLLTDDVADDTKSLVVKAIAAAKKAADNNVASTIAAKIVDNTWVGTSAFMKKASDAKLDAIVDASSNKMIDAFVNAVKGLNIHTENAAVELSLNEFTTEDIKAEMIPASSYINVYATSDEYKAAALWKKGSDNTEWESASWYTTAKNYEIPASFTNPAGYAKKMKTYFNELNKVDTTGDLLLQAELKEFKAMAPTVINWIYSDNQISALIQALQ